MRATRVRVWPMEETTNGFFVTLRFYDEAGHYYEYSVNVAEANSIAIEMMQAAAKQVVRSDEWHNSQISRSDKSHNSNGLSNSKIN